MVFRLMKLLLVVIVILWLVVLKYFCSSLMLVLCSLQRCMWLFFWINWLVSYGELGQLWSLLLGLSILMNLRQFIVVGGKFFLFYRWLMLFLNLVNLVVWFDFSVYCLVLVWVLMIQNGVGFLVMYLVIWIRMMCFSILV